MSKVRHLPSMGPFATIPEHLANKMNRTEATCPAHRGISSLFFTGYNGSAGFIVPWGWMVASSAVLSMRFFAGINSFGREGLLLANQPTQHPLSGSRRRISEVLNALYAMVG